MYCPRRNRRQVGGPQTPKRMTGGCRASAHDAGQTLITSYFLWPPKLNRSIRSAMAGLFSGTYGLLLLVMGLGKLSRLRLETGASPQFASINFKIET